METISNIHPTIQSTTQSTITSPKLSLYKIPFVLLFYPNSTIKVIIALKFYHYYIHLKICRHYLPTINASSRTINKMVLFFSSISQPSRVVALISQTTWNQLVIAASRDCDWLSSINRRHCWFYSFYTLLNFLSNKQKINCLLAYFLFELSYLARKASKVKV